MLKSYPSPEIERWTRDRPVMTGVLDQDTHALTGYIQTGEDVISALPEKRDRDAGEQHVAEHIHSCCRNLRYRFMRAHNVQIYDSLTNNRSKPLR